MKKLSRGCVVRMKASSGMVGYGNLQCVSSYIEPLSEVYFFGHNQGYHDYDIEEIVERPAEMSEVQKPSDNSESVKSLCDGCGNPLDEANNVTICSDCFNMISE
jgi:hypothetical protein